MLSPGSLKNIMMRLFEVIVGMDVGSYWGTSFLRLGETKRVRWTSGTASATDAQKLFRRSF